MAPHNNRMKLTAPKVGGRIGSGAPQLMRVFAGRRTVEAVRYDPTAGPDPEDWLALDEAEQLDAVLRQHKRAKERAGNLRLHSLIHATVETQLAQGHPQACAALARLLGEGLERHEAIHAIGSVFAGQIYRTMRGNDFKAGDYEQGLEGLTAASWRRSATEDDG